MRVTSLLIHYLLLCLFMCSGMETKIKSQREMILELEEKIKTNIEEIKKV